MKVKVSIIAPGWMSVNPSQLIHHPTKLGKTVSTRQNRQHPTKPSAPDKTVSTRRNRQHQTGRKVDNKKVILPITESFDKLIALKCRSDHNVTHMYRTESSAGIFEHPYRVCECHHPHPHKNNLHWSWYLCLL